jgi:hypothetical protein
MTLMTYLWRAIDRHGVLERAEVVNGCFFVGCQVRRLSGPRLR